MSKINQGENLTELKKTVVNQLEEKWEHMNVITDTKQEKDLIVNILLNIEVNLSEDRQQFRGLRG